MRCGIQPGTDPPKPAPWLPWHRGASSRSRRPSSSPAAAGDGGRRRRPTSAASGPHRGAEGRPPPDDAATPTPTRRPPEAEAAADPRGKVTELRLHRGRTRPLPRALGAGGGDPRARLRPLRGPPAGKDGPRVLQGAPSPGSSRSSSAGSGKQIAGSGSTQGRAFPRGPPGGGSRPRSPSGRQVPQTFGGPLRRPGRQVK